MTLDAYRSNGSSEYSVCDDGDDEDDDDDELLPLLFSMTSDKLSEVSIIKWSTRGR